MKKGFSLVELLIAIGIIAVIAAIAIPHLMRSRINANERAAEEIVQRISLALESYAFANNGSYATSITNLTSSNPRYLTENFVECIGSDCAVYGYFFYLAAAVDGSGYELLANPIQCGVTGWKIFNVTTRSALKVSLCPGPPGIVEPLPPPPPPPVNNTTNTTPKPPRKILIR